LGFENLTRLAISWHRAHG